MLTDKDRATLEWVKSIGRVDGRLPLDIDKLIDIIDRQSRALQLVDDWACSGNIENYRELSDKIEDIIEGRG